MRQPDQARHGEPRNGARRICVRAIPFKRRRHNLAVVGQPAESTMTRRAAFTDWTVNAGLAGASSGQSGGAHWTALTQIDAYRYDDHGQATALQALLHHERGLVVQHAIPERVFLEDELAGNEQRA